MDKIPIYTDVENLMQIFELDRQSGLFHGMKQFISKEANLTFCSDETTVVTHPLFGHLAKEFASGDFRINYINEGEDFLISPFKTNLQEKFSNKQSILFSNDNARIESCSKNNGLLIGGIGQEKDIYNQLNFHKEFFRANRILTIGQEFVNYENFEPFILPFTEIIINEPYLFVPERKEYEINQYLNHNFEPLFRSILKKASNKINIVVSTFVNEQNQNSSHWHDLKTNSFNPLFKYLKDFLNRQLGGARYKLWLIVSPMARQARHDRYILTNYQYIESGAGLTYFDHRGILSIGEKEFIYIL